MAALALTGELLAACGPGLGGTGSGGTGGTGIVEYVPPALEKQMQQLKPNPVPTRPVYVPAPGPLGTDQRNKPVGPGRSITR